MKTELLQIRVSPEEKRAIQELAGDVPVARYVVKRLLGDVAVEPKPTSSRAPEPRRQMEALRASVKTIETTVKPKKNTGYGVQMNDLGEYEEAEMIVSEKQTQYGRRV